MGNNVVLIGACLRSLEYFKYILNGLIFNSNTAVFMLAIQPRYTWNLYIRSNGFELISDIVWCMHPFRFPSPLCLVWRYTGREHAHKSDKRKTKDLHLNDSLGMHQITMFHHKYSLSLFVCSWCLWFSMLILQKLQIEKNIHLNL